MKSREKACYEERKKLKEKSLSERKQNLIFFGLGTELKNIMINFDTLSVKKVYKIEIYRLKSENDLNLKMLKPIFSIGFLY